MDLYAAYHIQKLRRHLLIILAAGFVFGAITSAVNPIPEANEFEENIFLENRRLIGVMSSVERTQGFQLP